ncbi:MAG: tRNA dihydrouridine synthase DusB [Clostridia bacterium]|nr:tRNA dihydrouridine synthase DusB [Clostridia bacterium]MBO5417489.1 tRNA dihydrouridine synthase DusB [Clostridia bacterium]
MKIGNVEIKNGVFLAPMAGVTDLAFRYMCKKYGAGGMVTEMVSAKAICYGDRKTAKLAYISDFERPCGLQLFGSEPDIMAKAALIVFDMFHPEFIDVNMGCPAPKIVNNGEGSSLMKNPALCYEIVSRMKAALGDRCPITVKMRRGFDKDSINAVEVAEMCQKGGADAVFVHARTREQMYMPPVEYSTIAEVKKAVKIPVIGNGDIMCGRDAVKLRELTGCDGVMVGRAAQGNPFVFDEINAFLEGRDYTPPTNEQKRDCVKEHIARLIEDKGEYVGVREARKHVAWYIKGQPGSASMRNRVNLAESTSKMMSLIDEAFGF